MSAGTAYRALAVAQFTSSIDDYALAEYARVPRHGFDRRAAAGVRHVHTFAVQSGSQLEDTFSPLLADGSLRPVVDVFPFSEGGARAAYAKCLAGHATGKIVIRVRDD
ncbi:hypothetical protein H4217_000723 [Coemansia sp. RSA 1939]|nr:hypothetical protein H4217_000723 [Coemansia sp. RSA 1939]KAJ2613539.1 hypothetical protein EV177_002486 [Coemansia sp. RSA 1804]KAJ2695121.1 hypothetical protein GGH99_000308 [Coemansia sp. RSA 1285]